MPRLHLRWAELQVTRICDTGKQYIDLAHGEHTLQATTDDVLDGESLRLVDLLLGVEDTQKIALCITMHIIIAQTVRA